MGREEDEMEGCVLSGNNEKRFDEHLWIGSLLQCMGKSAVNVLFNVGNLLITEER